MSVGEKMGKLLFVLYWCVQLGLLPKFPIKHSSFDRKEISVVERDGMCMK